MSHQSGIFCKAICLLMTGMFLVTTSCGLMDDIMDEFSDDTLNESSSNNHMLEGIWDGTLEYPESSFTSFSVMEFSPSGQVLYFSENGVDLFSLDPFATVQCDVSSDFAVNLNVQYSYYDEIEGIVYCEAAMVGTMDPTGNSLSGSGTKTFTMANGVVNTYTIHAESTKRSGGPNESANNHMLEGIWDGTLEYPESSSFIEMEFLSSGEAIYFALAGVGNGPDDTMQCDVASDLTLNLTAQGSLFIPELDDYFDMVVEMSGDMDPAGNIFSASGTLSLFHDQFGELGTSDIYAECTKLSGLLRGDGEGSRHNPWHHDYYFSTKR